MSSAMYGYGFSSMLGVLGIIIYIAFICLIIYITCLIVFSFVKKYKRWVWENDPKYKNKQLEE